MLVGLLIYALVLVVTPFLSRVRARVHKQGGNQPHRGRVLKRTSNLPLHLPTAR
jgi:hypothetical protein